MSWPGESLLKKMWKSLIDNGVGGLLKPAQIEREGVAAANAKAYEHIALAQAEVYAQQIKAGTLTLIDSKYKFGQAVGNLAPNNATARLEYPNALEVAASSAATDALRKEINVAKAIAHATEELKNDTTAVPEEDIDADWLYRWRDFAGNVSATELQSLWGKILAGEIKNPGAVSLRALEVVRNLTTAEAELVERIAPFVLGGSIISKEQLPSLEAEGIKFDTLLDLQEIGILSGVDSFGLTMEYTCKNPKDKKYSKTILCHDRVLIIEHDDPQVTLSVEMYSVTKIGRQIMELGKFSAKEDYLRSFGRHIIKSGFRVKICRYELTGNGMFKVVSSETVTGS